MHEAQLHTANSFLTLTYDDAHLPPDGSLRKRDWQLFAKRLRKAIGPFRFFHCGEYGDTTRRPHYHAAILGHAFEHDRRPLPKRSSSSFQLYTSATLTRTWPHGYHRIGDLTFESAAYVARYIAKKITGDQAEEHYGGRTPEYVTMSRRPGIGQNWYLTHGHEVRRHDTVISRGREARPPRYYDALSEAHDPEGFAETKRERIRSAKKWEANNTPERLAVREQVAKARLALRRRDADGD